MLNGPPSIIKATRRLVLTLLMLAWTTSVIGACSEVAPFVTPSPAAPVIVDAPSLPSQATMASESRATADHTPTAALSPVPFTVLKRIPDPSAAPTLASGSTEIPPSGCEATLVRDQIFAGGRSERPAHSVPPPDEELAKLQTLAVEVVNGHRRHRGLPPLRLSENPAALILAEDSLDSLRLAPKTSLGFTSAMLYNQFGGTGYVSAQGAINGYFSETALSSCRSPSTICERVDPEREIEDYYDRRLQNDTSSELNSTIFSPVWDAVSVGVAYTDLTFILYELYERDGIEYVEEPTITNGYLTFKARAGGDPGFTRLIFYYHPLPSPGTGPATTESVHSREPAFRVVEPPLPGHFIQLPDSQTHVADRWVTCYEQVSVVADVSELIGEPGVYEMIMWSSADEPVPLAQYHIYVDDAAVLDTDNTSSPVPDPTPFPIEELRQYALNLINRDRIDHGTSPVTLGTNASAQLHAEDALSHGYVGHWTIDGLKPYMLYRLQGGVGVVAENAAGTVSAEHMAHCRDPLVYCVPSLPRDVIRELQWAMMYDDAESDWGHRDTIIDPSYDRVNIGIAHNELGTTFFQHFEFVAVEYVDQPSIQNGDLVFSVRPLGDQSIAEILVYYDPLPQPRTAEAIGSLRSYCTGGGFTAECDGVRPVLRILMPPELRWGEGYTYADLAHTDIVAKKWQTLDGFVRVEAPMTDVVSRDGVYTLMLWSDADEPSPMGLFSIFIKN